MNIILSEAKNLWSFPRQTKPTRFAPLKMTGLLDEGIDNRLRVRVKALYACGYDRNSRAHICSETVPVCCVFTPAHRDWHRTRSAAGAEWRQVRSVFWLGDTERKFR